MNNYSAEEQERFRSIIIEQIKKNLAEKFCFVATVVDNNQYWLLSNIDDGNINRVIVKQIEHYCSYQREFKFNQKNNYWESQMTAFGFSCLNDPCVDYYRIMILYLEAIYYFMMLNSTLLDIDVLRQIKIKYLSFSHLRMLKNYCMLIDENFSINIK